LRRLEKLKSQFKLIKTNKDFSQRLREAGISDTRIPEFIEALQKVYNALSVMDEETLSKLKNIGDLEYLFELYMMSCSHTRKIKLGK